MNAVGRIEGSHAVNLNQASYLRGLTANVL